MNKLIDIHTHVLPLVDDGANNFEESIAMLEKMASEGVTDCILTPHVDSFVSKASRSVHLENFNRLKILAKDNGINVTLHLGAEIRYRFNSKLDYNDYRLGNSNYILLEFSSRREYIEDIIYNIKHRGLNPIIAHIERYNIPYDHYQKIKKSGGLLQVNTGAILGHDGRRIKKLVYKMLDDKLVDFVASDTHGIKRRVPNLNRAYQLLSKRLDLEYLDAIFYSNAKNIINDKGWNSSLFGLIN